MTARDWRKRTVLHLAAGQGNTLLAQLFLEAVGENDRAFFAAALDQGGHVISLHHYNGFYIYSHSSFVRLSYAMTGYTAEDLARLAGFARTADTIQSLGGLAVPA